MRYTNKLKKKQSQRTTWGPVAHHFINDWERKAAQTRPPPSQWFLQKSRTATNKLTNAVSFSMGHLIRSCTGPFTSSSQRVKLGDYQSKNSLKTSDISQESFRGCFRPSSEPDGEMELQEESPGFGYQTKKNFHPFHFNHKRQEESPLLVH